MCVTALLAVLLLVAMMKPINTPLRGLYAFDKTGILPLRGILALLIVSHHLALATDIPILSEIPIEFGEPIVAIFFFISGYGLCVSYRVRGSAYLTGFLGKRFGKLLPKLVLLSALMIVWYHLTGIKDAGSMASEVAGGWTPLPNSWFIYSILWVYLAFYLCGSIVKTPKALGRLFLCSSFVYVFLTAGVLGFKGYWWVTIICVNVGYFVALYEDRLTSFLTKCRRVSISMSACVLCISMAGLWRLSHVRGVSFLFHEAWLVSVALAVYLLVRMLRVINPSWLCYMGVISLEIYLVHGIPLEVGERLGLEGLWLWGFAYVITIPSAILLYKGFDWMAEWRRSGRVMAE